MTYEEYYWEQSGEKRFRLNELTIWAVNKLCDTETNITGSKAFLRGRLDKLIKDIKYEGWRRASARMRKAVDRWIVTHSQEEHYEKNI